MYKSKYSNYKLPIQNNIIKVENWKYPWKSYLSHRLYYSHYAYAQHQSFPIISSILGMHIVIFRSHMIPHPEKAHRGGEDAYFNSSHMLVVADGVGGWNNQGVDPSKYSRFLCSS